MASEEGARVIVFSVELGKKTVSFLADGSVRDSAAERDRSFFWKVKNGKVRIGYGGQYMEAIDQIQDAYQAHILNEVTREG